MITKKLIDENIENIKESIEEALSLAKQNQKRENDYILLLANCSVRIESGEYHFLSSFSYEDLGDMDRGKFIDFYLGLPIEKYYQDVNQKQKETLRKHTMFLELMIYSHIWESIPNLKTLFKIKELINGNIYPWIIDVPEMSKHNFIRNQIRDELKITAPKLTSVITESFNSQIRNAFAHSQISYWLSESSEVVQLHNHNPDDNWSTWGISFTDLEKKIANSILLFNLIDLKIMEEIQKITEKQKEFKVSCLEKDGSFGEYELKYDESQRGFKWK